MTTLLVTISLLLHGVTFLWIMTLLQKQQPTQSTDMENVKNEIEDLLISYTAEMKEKNELLLRQLDEMQTRNKYSQESKSSESKRNLKAKQDESERPETKDSVAGPRAKRELEAVKEIQMDDYHAYQPPLIEMEEELVYEQSDSAKVMALSKQGLSTLEIAKKLNLGKGEVELMLKFYR